MSPSTPTLSTYGEKLGEPTVTYKQGIPNGPSPGMTIDEEEAYDSESEYHDEISDIRELEQRVDPDIADKNTGLHEALLTLHKLR